MEPAIPPEGHDAHVIDLRPRATARSLSRARDELASLRAELDRVRAQLHDSEARADRLREVAAELAAGGRRALHEASVQADALELVQRALVSERLQAASDPQAPQGDASPAPRPDLRAELADLLAADDGPAGASPPATPR